MIIAIRLCQTEDGVVYTDKIASFTYELDAKAFGDSQDDIMLLQSSTGDIVKMGRVVSV